MSAIGERRDDVIVIDESTSDYDALLAAGQAEGIRIRRFATVNDALRAARPQSAAIWLVSTRLPDMSSLELLALLRRRVRRAIVFLVGDAYSPAEEVAARLAGATGYVCKPLACQWLGAGLPRGRSPSIRAGPACVGSAEFS